MSYIVTFTGKRFWPMAPSTLDISIEDIAHALAKTDRFGGHLDCFYSNAQHSLLVGSMCPPGLEFCGSMHDAHEAYIQDLTKPFKLDLPDYRKAEAYAWSAVAEKFDLPDPIPDEVKEADRRALCIEVLSLRPQFANLYDIDMTERDRITPTVRTLRYKYRVVRAIVKSSRDIPQPWEIDKEDLLNVTYNRLTK